MERLNQLSEEETVKIFKATATNTSYPVYVVARSLGDAVIAARNYSQPGIDGLDLKGIVQLSEDSAHIILEETK